MQDAVQQIKDRLNIVDVVSSYVRLNQAGRSYKGLSPFKKEKTPSFFVSPDKGMYYCFSTQKGGDIFTFVSEMEGVDFRGALKILAERAGVPLEAVSKEAQDARARLCAVLEEATALYREILKNNHSAKAYLTDRGISDATQESFLLGYAPAPEATSWRFIYEQLRARGFTDDEIDRAGLIKWKDEGVKTSGECYDRFRSRILFPIFDASGRPIAFSGRLYPAGENDKAPKYLNSPDTELYHKSSVLYGYDRAKQHIRKYDCAILVEGQMDLVLSHQMGFTHTVALSGTGLTFDHMELLSRVSKNIIFAFDADSAGVHSTIRASRMALQRGMEVKVVLMPEGKDPADCIKEDPELWRGAVRSALPAVQYMLRVVERGAKDEESLRRDIERLVLPLIADIQNSIHKAQSASMVAERLSVPTEAVLVEVSRIEKEMRSQPTKSIENEYTPSELSQRTVGVEYDKIGALTRALIGAVLVAEDNPQSPIAKERIEEMLKEVLTEEEKESALSEHRADPALIFETELFLFEEGVDIERKVEELTLRLRLYKKREEFTSAMNELSLIEREGKDTDNVLGKLNTLKEELTLLERSLHST